MIEKIIAPKLAPLDADLLRQTRQQIMMDRGKVKNPIKDELNNLRHTATIDIKDKEFAEAYKKFLDAYFKVSAGKG